MESPTYIITYTNGRKTHESKRELEKTIDDLVDEEVAKIVKEYKFGRKIYVCTLYTNEQEFGAEEYITVNNITTTYYFENERPVSPGLIPSTYILYKASARVSGA